MKQTKCHIVTSVKNDIELKTRITTKSEWTNSNYLNTYYLNGEYLSDKELLKQIPQWSYPHPILITAPTGSGKNYFIEHYLLPYVSGQKVKISSDETISLTEKIGEKNKKDILIVSNRIALNFQIKKRICKLLGLEKIIEETTDIGFQRLETFDNVTILTYQKLWELTSKNAISGKKYQYAIFDECHYFYSDSEFIPHTNLLLNKIPIAFYSAVRIYMTATPEQVVPYIIDAETSSANNKLFEYTYNNPFCIETYIFSSTAKNVCYYKYARSEDAIINLINNDHSNNKWLWFVRKKASSEYIQNKLRCASKFISTDSKNSDNDSHDTYLTLLGNEKFDEKVLLSTTVINNGINIKDSEFTNVVISSFDETDIRQMMGRKRFCSPDDRLNVYFLIPSKQQISGRLHYNYLLMDAINNFEQYYGSTLNALIQNRSDETMKALSNLLIHYNKKTHINTIGKKRLYHNSNAYSTLLASEEFEADVAKYFLRIVDAEESFSMCNFVENELTSNDSEIQKIIEFLKPKLNITLYKEQQAAFRHELTEIWPKDLKMQKYTKPKRVDGLSNINKNLAHLKLQFKLTSKKIDGETVWILISTDNYH